MLGFPQARVFGEPELDSRSVSRLEVAQALFARQSALSHVSTRRKQF